MQEQQIPFYKLSGTGNDFIVLDNRAVILKEEQKSEFTKKVCDRRCSLGADGVLLLEASGSAHFYMRIFNSDGQEGEMCGNGVRCIAYFAHQEGIAPAAMFVETLSGMVEAEVSGSRVNITLWETAERPSPMNIRAASKDIQVHYLEMGVPHAVLVTPELEQMDARSLERIGREIRYHKAFPRGANVNFLQIVDSRNIIVRTYERGVEAETLACGTGSIASAVVAGALDGRMVFPLTVHVRGGLLEVSLRSPSGSAETWRAGLAGEVRAIAKGYVLPGGYL